MIVYHGSFEMLLSTIAMIQVKLLVTRFLCEVFMQVANLYLHFAIPFSTDTKMCCLHFINILLYKNTSTRDIILSP